MENFVVCVAVAVVFTVAGVIVPIVVTNNKNGEILLKEMEIKKKEEEIKKKEEEIKK